MSGDPMNPMRDFTLCLLGLSLAASTSAISQQERDRTKIPEKYRWNLADIYPNDDAWAKAKDAFVAKIGAPGKDEGAMERFKNRLAESPATLLDCLNESSGLAKEYARISVYASLLSDQDINNASNLEKVQTIGQVGSTFGAKLSFIEPELLKMGKEKIESFIAAEPKLGIYKHYLEDVLRRKNHTGTTNEEKIIADASLMADAPYNIYGVFSNAEFPYPSVKLSNDSTVVLDKANFSKYRALPNREDRMNVFDAFFGAIDKYKGSFGAQLYAEVKKDMFYKNARNYGSSLEVALDGDNIPVAVYKGLVKSVNDNLATFHRYLKLRQRMLGVDQLHYYDLYAPVVKNTDINYSYEEAEKLVLASLTPLGPDYIAVAKKGFADRWLDVYPNTGKRSGAYSQGAAYDIHPYMLLNYNGKYDDVSTLAHEFGHTMHSYLANTSQPWPTSQYSTFVAEVASTFNEALLLDHMLKTVKDDDVRLSMLGNYLDNMKGTLFRQTQFAEFELAIHESAESGVSLTGDMLDALYEKITRRYYGHDQGICIVDSCVRSEWAYIPHFYYNFYVFQYATSVTASSALSEEVLAGDKAVTKKYLEMLRSGGADYPIELLKKAGIDMTTPVPFQLAMKKMNRVMDEMEKILDKKK